jgi:hypothetical protein
MDETRDETERQLLATIAQLHEQAQVLKDLAAAGQLRCERTGNPCGTDTVPRGSICGCVPCWALALATLPAEELVFSRIIHPE